MTEFAKMDMFFFVTTIAVVLITIVLVISAVYIIRILNDIKYISQKAKTETDHLAADIQQLRENVKEEGAKLKTFSKFFTAFYKRYKK